MSEIEAGLTRAWWSDDAAARVVIAEDEAIVRLDLKEILLEAGYDVVGETGRGDEAVELVDQHRPELAILDIKMPGMDGVRVAREITSRHRVAVLLLTAFSQRELIEEARESGVSAYLVKPFRRNELLPAIEQVLVRARQDWAIDEEEDAEAAGSSVGSPAGDRPPGAQGERSPASGDGEAGARAGDGMGNRVAEDKIETRRIVEEAKSMLMEQHGMAEADAFSYIQRTAMQTRGRMRDVAQQVVDGSLTP